IWMLALGGISLVVVGLLYVALVADSFNNDGKPLTTLLPRGPAAQSIQDLVVPVFAVAGVVLVLVLGSALLISWRFRERREDAELGEDEKFPAQIHGKTTLEVGWTVAPAVLLAFIAVGTVITI